MIFCTFLKIAPEHPRAAQSRPQSIYKPPWPLFSRNKSHMCHPGRCSTVVATRGKRAFWVGWWVVEVLGMLANAQAGVAKPKSCYATPSGACKRKHDGRGGDRKSALYKLQKQMGPTAAPQLKS